MNRKRLIGFITAILIVVSGLTIVACNDDVVKTKKHSVVFDFGVQGIVNSTVRVTDGETVSRPASPENGDKELTGWYLNQDLSGDAWDFASDKVTCDIVLYARWEEGGAPPPSDKVKVTFMYNLGELGVYKTVEIDKGGKVTVPVRPFSKDAIFDFWYTDEGGTRRFGFNTPIVADTVLYAKWYPYETQDDFKYALVGEGYYIAAAAELSGELTIPSKYKSKEVVAVASEGFKDMALIKVYIPDSVELMGLGAFAGCEELSEIRLPFVGERADDGGNPELGWIFAASEENNLNASVPVALKKVTVDGDEVVFSSAFKGCSSLASLTVTEKTLEISGGALNGCRALTELTLPFAGSGVGETALFGYVFGATSAAYNSGYLPTGLKKLTITGGEKIEKASFSFLSCLEELTLPFVGESVSSAGKSAVLGWLFGSARYPGSYEARQSYEGATADAKYFGAYIPSTLKKITILGGDIKHGAFSSFSKVEEYRLPEGIEGIGDYAFQNNTSLTSFKVPESIKKIGNYAFWWCEFMTSVTLPNGLTGIGEEAFGSCIRLESLTLPSSLRDVGDMAFFGIYNITDLTIPEGVVKLGVEVCRNMCGLERINLPSTLKEIAVDPTLLPIELPGIMGSLLNSLQKIEVAEGNTAFYSDSGVLIDKKTQTMAHVPHYVTGAFTIPSGETEIADQAFYEYHNLTEVTVGPNVTAIGSEAFYNCKGLTAVHMGENVTAIGTSAFYGCRAAVDWGGCKITKLDREAFSGYEGERLIIPKTVTAMGRNVFLNSRAEVVWQDGSEMEKIDEYAFAQYMGIRIEVPSSVKTIGSYAFQNANRLAEVILPDSVTLLEFDVFMNTPFHESLIKNQSGPVYINKIFYTYAGRIAEGETVAIKPDTVSIASYAFYYQSGLNSVVIPDSVKIIGYWAFAYCGGLKTVTLGSGLERICLYAFNECRSLSAVAIPPAVKDIGYAFSYVPGSVTFVGESSLTELPKYTFMLLGGDVVIPKSITKIHSTAFQNMTGKVEFERGSLLSELGDEAFTYYKGESLELPDGVTKLGNKSFYNASELNELSLPALLSDIGDFSFAYCSALKTLTLKSAVPPVIHPTLDNGSQSYNLFTYLSRKDGTSYLPTRIVVPKGSLAAYRSADGWKLYADNITEEEADGGFYIKDGVLERYTGSERDITLPSGISAIGDMAFAGSDAESITVSSEVTSIGELAFYNCRNLRVVYLRCAADIVVGRLTTASALTYTFLADGAKAYKSGGFKSYSEYIFDIADVNGDYVVSGTKLVKYIGNDTSITVDKAGVTEIGAYAFYGSPVTSVVIGGGVSSVGAYAFAETDVVSIDLGGVMRIGLYAFYAGKLTEVAIPDSVVFVGDNAFDSCAALKSVTLGRGLIFVGSETFARTAGLTSVVLPDTVTSMGSAAFSFSGISHITLSEKLTTLSDYTFSGCKNLTSVTIPASVVTLGTQCFGSCDNLAEVSASGNVKKVGVQCFVGCLSLQAIDLSRATTLGESCFQMCKALKSVTLGQATAIPPLAFGYCNSLLAVEIPESVAAIGEKAFYCCYALRTVRFNEGLETIGASAFEACYKLDSAALPDSVTGTGERVFAFCYSLRSVKLPVNEKYTTVNNYLFNRCMGLIKVSIPKNVHTIGYYAFSYCVALTNVDIDPDGILYQIWEYAFCHCESLESVTLYFDNLDRYDSEYGKFIEKSIYKSCFAACYKLKEVNLVNCTWIQPYVFSDCIALERIVLPKSINGVGSNTFAGCVGLKAVCFRGTHSGQWTWPPSWRAGCSATVYWEWEEGRI